MFNTLFENFYKTFIRDDRWTLFLDGLKTTILISFFACLVGVAIGIIVSVVKVYNHRTKKLSILTAIFNVYTTIIRGTPVVVQLLIMYFIICVNIEDGVIVGFLTFGINSGAYVSEIFRGGILSIDKGQTEAGRALGLSELTTMKSIILPQAIKNTLPAIFNEFITLIKETSIVGYIAVIDLTKAGDLVRARTMEVYFSLISVALVYLIIVVGLTFLQKKLEKKLSKGDR